ncbi:MAG: glycerate kinase [Bacteroidales bacterium]|nr:glycerate kinase [Bacteroidales bacterium]MBN2758777.1 glycerate kinase [Bacteroidales bacterium]
MNILIAPDSFKGSLSANEIIDILKNKFKNSKLNLNIIEQALADGGEGSIDIFTSFEGFQKNDLQILNPIGKKIDSFYLFDKKNSTAYIELAKSSGLSLIKDNPDIMAANSSGTGELVKDAILKGASKIILFLGGSATNDAAVGILDALGFEFYDKNNKQLSAYVLELKNIFRIDNSKSITKNCNVSFIIAVDVNNPFYGKNGASYVYAAQKGASLEQIKYLDASLKSFSKILKKQYGVDIQSIKGSGAAGGIAGSLYAVLNAKIVSGSDLIFEKVDIENKIKQADIVITGEGKIDNQTLNEKLIFKLSKLCKKHYKPIWAICGYFDGNIDLKEKLYLNKIFSLSERKSDIESSIKNAEKGLNLLSKEIIDSLQNISK